MPLLGATYNRETLIPADVFVMEKQLQMDGAPAPYVLIVPVGLEINLPLEIQVIHSDELLVPGTNRGHAVLVSMTESPMPLGMDVCVARNLEIAV